MQIKVVVLAAVTFVSVHGYLTYQRNLRSERARATASTGSAELNPRTPSERDQKPRVGRPDRAAAVSPARIAPSELSSNAILGALTREELLELAGRLDVLELQQVHHAKVRALVARDFSDFERVFTWEDFRTGEPLTDETLDRAEDGRADFAEKHSAISKVGNIGFQALWTVVVGGTEGSLLLRLDPRISYGGNSSGKTTETVSGVGIRGALQIGKSRHDFHSFAMRVSKIDGHYWSLASLAGCDPELSKYLSGIAARIPTEPGGTVTARLLSANGNWNELQPITWTHHDVDILDRIPSGVTSKNCMDL